MMEKKLPWIISAVLAGLLIIVTFLWIDAMQRLSGGNLSVQRDLIREYCGKSDEASRERCSEELADLQTMLEDFAKDLREAPLEATVQVSTSTATSSNAR